MIELNSKAAKAHTDLNHFLSIKDKLVGKRALHLNEIEAPELAPFQDNLIISRRLDGGSDFAFEFWGEENTIAYGADLTGHSILSANFGDLTNFFLTVDCQILSLGEAVYLNGVFDWLDKEHQKWFRVALPLNGPDGLERVLSYTSFEDGD